MTKDIGIIKIVHIMFILTIATLVIGGSFFVNLDPLFRMDMAKAKFEQLLYAAELARTTGPVIATSTREDQTYTSVPVLVYHGVLGSPDGSKINVTQEQFKNEMFALKKAGYKTLTIEQLEWFMQNKFIPGQKSVVITFDDGRRDSFYNADPVLAAVSYNAIMHVIVSESDGNKIGGYYLSAPELRYMNSTGRWEIESHSYDGHGLQPTGPKGQEGYFFSSFRWLADKGRQETKQEFNDRITNDFALSKAYLEQITNKPIRTFAFPFGEIGQKFPQELSSDILNAASKYFDILFYQNRPGEYYTQTYQGMPQINNSFAVRRIIVQSDWSASDLLTYIDKGNAKQLPYNDAFNADSGWVKAWGTYTIKNGELLLMPKPSDQTGAAIILDGSGGWKNYSLTTHTRIENGADALIYLRFSGDKNNAACNFGTNFAHVEQSVDGQSRVIKGVIAPNMLPENGDVTLGASVNGRTVSCFINGKKVVSTNFLDPSLENGGIGFKTWIKTPGVARLHIYDVSVNQL